MSLTKLTNLIDPEVLTVMVSAKLPHELKYVSIAEVDTTLEGTAGSTLTMPYFKYTGKANELGEGEAVTYDLLTTDKKAVTVKKYAKGIHASDESILSGYGDKVSEIVNQIAIGISHAVDDAILTTLDGAIQTSPAVGGLTVANLQTALDMFEDEADAKYILFCEPVQASKLRTDAGTTFLSGTEVGANALMKGIFGDVLGAQIVRAKSLKGKDTAYLVKKGAIMFVRKRGVEIELARDIDHQTTKFVGTLHGVPFLYDPSKVVKITLS